MKFFMSKFTAFFFLSFIFQGCVDLRTLKSYYVSDDHKISEEQLSRLSNYLGGELYSNELKRIVFAYPMAFLISNKGDKSVILACEGINNECNNSVHVYQLIQKYKKVTNQNFKILALNKNILSQNIKIMIKQHKTNSVVKSKKNNFYDLILIPADSCSGDDC